MLAKQETEENTVYIHNTYVRFAYIKSERYTLFSCVLCEAVTPLFGPLPPFTQ